jgi:hypothetical protein
MEEWLELQPSFWRASWGIDIFDGRVGRSAPFTTPKCRRLRGEMASGATIRSPITTHLGPRAPCLTSRMFKSRVAFTRRYRLLDYSPSMKCATGSCERSADARAYQGIPGHWWHGAVLMSCSGSLDRVRSTLDHSSPSIFWCATSHHNQQTSR